jgi:hypothetical protein
MGKGMIRLSTLSLASAVAAIAAVALFPVPLVAASPAARPVIVGLDGAEFDACGSQGSVRGLKDDGVLPVREAPATDAAESDRLRNGAPVMLCDSSKDGKWIGVVYPGSGQTMADCAVSSPVLRRGPYSGPCRSGWVASTFVAVTAG